MIDELMVNCVGSAIVSAIVFYGLKLQGEWILFWLAYFVAVCVGVSMAYCVASFVPNLDVGNALVPIYAVTLLFFSGFLISIPDIPPWWRWYSYICHSRYAWGATMINQFQGANNIMYLGNQTVLEFYQLDGVKSKWTYVGFTALFFVFFFCATWAILSFKRYTIR